MEKTKVDWQEFCEEGRKARDVLDKTRWIIGDMAASIETKYRGHSIEDFAREIGLSKRAVYQYKQICEFYNLHARAICFRQFESDLITYSHYREAMRMGEYGYAIEMLERAAANAWTTDELAYRVGIQLGSTTHERVYLAKEVEGFIASHVGETTVTFTMPLDAKFENGDTVKVSVWRED